MEIEVKKALKEKKDATPLINEQIRSPKVQLITQQGENIGVVTRFDALRMAEAAGLDLVIISDSGADQAPVVKIMNFGKVLY